ncbi:MAG: recombinase family protein [Oscillospiraceae bacterium]
MTSTTYFPDPQTGPIVLAIFRMVAENHTLHFIAKTLNEQGVPSPGRYLYDIGLRKTEKFKNAIWYLQTIKKILVDPVYLGWIVSGKYRSQLCERGQRLQLKRPKRNGLSIKVCMNPLFPKSFLIRFRTSSRLGKVNRGLATIYDSKSKRRSMFKGILRCGECGRSMYLRSKSNRGYYYYCTLHENYNATICPKKAVKQEDVESLALRLIQTQIRAFSDAQRLIANLNATPSSQTRYQIYETQIDDAKRKIEKFNQLKAALYGDFADGLLSHQDYTDLSEDYSRRADDLRIFIAELEKEKEKYSVGFGSKMQWALLIEKYKDQESLDAEMAAAFIETLTLFNDGHVEVAFRHRDEIEQVLYVAATRGKEAERYAG